jgi:hypothetical protein
MDNDYEEGICNNYECGYISKELGDLKLWHSKYNGNETSCFCFKCYDERVKREDEDIIAFGEEGIKHLKLEFRREYTNKLQKKKVQEKLELNELLKKLNL